MILSAWGAQKNTSLGDLDTNCLPFEPCDSALFLPQTERERAGLLPSWQEQTSEPLKAERLKTS